ncbi:MAG: DUF3667 domain-containing protein [Lentimicrobiaceae bacterium]|nr:DUF3667 domain-containing protein [Lentimicrobiaceae bacterium]
MKWFKKRQRPLPEETVCRNCGTQTVGRYCHECGQDLFAGIGQPILKMTAHVFEHAFALEGRTPRTLFNLMFRPGFLPNEYYLGKINRYVHPVKLFWMSSLIFFALLIGGMNFDNLQPQVTTSGSAKINIHLKNNALADTLVNNQIQAHGEEDAEKINKALEIGSVLVKYGTKFAPYATFLLIPIFALLLAWFFWRKKLFYIFHLVFAVHFHTFLWIYFSILLIINMCTPKWTYPGWLSFLLFLIPGVYLSIAFYRFYHSKTRWQAVWKAIIIGILYFLLIIIVTMLLIVLVVRIFFPEVYSS